MAVQPSLLPSLSALLPATSYQLFLSRLSLQAIHIEPYHIRDDIYISTATAVPGQIRTLRLRAEQRSVARHSNAKGKAKREQWVYSLAFVSPPLSGRENSEMNVRACVAVDIAGLPSRGDIQAFIHTIGFKHSHSYARHGYLFYLPLPITTVVPLTLHLTVTRLAPPSGEAHPSRETSEPYLLQLLPSRPVAAVSQRGEPGLQDMVGIIRGTADRLDGIQWETGR